MSKALRIENAPYTDQPAEYFDNVVIDLELGSSRGPDPIVKLLDADDPKIVRAAMDHPRIRIDARGVFLVGGNALWDLNDAAHATRYAWKLPLSIFQNLPDGVEVREATDEEQRAALDKFAETHGAAAAQSEQRRVTPGELATAPKDFCAIRLVYGNPERPCANLIVGLSFGFATELAVRSTDPSGWLPVRLAEAPTLHELAIGDQRVKVSWPPTEGDRITIQTGPARPKDFEA